MDDNFEKQLHEATQAMLIAAAQITQFQSLQSEEGQLQSQKQMAALNVFISQMSAIEDSSSELPTPLPAVPEELVGAAAAEAAADDDDAASEVLSPAEADQLAAILSAKVDARLAEQETTSREWSRVLKKSSSDAKLSLQESPFAELDPGFKSLFTTGGGSPGSATQGPVGAPVAAASFAALASPGGGAGGLKASEEGLISELRESWASCGRVNDVTASAIHALVIKDAIKLAEAHAQERSKERRKTWLGRMKGAIKLEYKAQAC
eukprot:jgi/Mesen1/8409/ME000471S07729